MKRLLLLLSFLALALPAHAQISRADGVIFGNSGRPQPNAIIAVCTQPATTYLQSSPPPCSPLATLYTDSTGSTACNGMNGCSNPITADGLGNWHFYANNTVKYTYQVYGVGITTYVQVDQQLAAGGGASGGGLASVGMTGDGTVFNASVTNSPVTTSNQPGPLTPTLKSVPAGWALLGPRPVVPGGAAFVQANSGYTAASNPTSIVIPLLSNSNATDGVVFSGHCLTHDDNIANAVVTDTQGNTYANAIQNGSDGQWFTYNIIGGADTVTVTFTYGGGQTCNGLVYSIREFTNMSGSVDASGGNSQFFSSGTYVTSLTTTQPNDLLVMGTSNDYTAPPSIIAASPIFTIDAPITGTTLLGYGVFADAASSVPGLYSVSVASAGTWSTTQVVAYETGGTFNYSLPPTYRQITPGDLPVAATPSPNTVLNNQSNAYSTGYQDMGNATAFRVPTSSGATAANQGKLAYDLTAGQLHSQIGTNESILTGYWLPFAPNDMDCAIWRTNFGETRLDTAGARCGTGGSVTSIATTSPLSGGTITTTGTLSCPTCVVASSPGVGLAHFAGSTQTVTSSAVNLAGGANEVTNRLPALNLPTATVFANQLNTYTNGDTQIFGASTTGGASLNIPTGTAPTSPNSGDVWNLSGVLQYWDGSNTNSLMRIQGPVVNGHCPQFSGTTGLVTDTGAVCGSGGSSLFASWQFASNAAITGTGQYFQLLPGTGLTSSYSGAGTSGSPFIATLTLANNLTLGGTTTGTFSGNVTGNVTGNASTATSATSATTSTNIAGGALGSVPYQSAANTTTFVSSPTTSGHTFAMAWQPSGSAIAPAALDLATYLASPPSIGTGSPGIGSFTTLTSNSTSTLNGTVIPASVTLTRTVGSGTFALTNGTTAISPGACQTTTVVSISGVTTSDNIALDFASNPTGVTGYGPSGQTVTIYKWPTAGNINIAVCSSSNNSGSITPGAMNVNYHVFR